MWWTRLDARTNWSTYLFPLPIHVQVIRSRYVLILLRILGGLQVLATSSYRLFPWRPFVPGKICYFSLRKLDSESCMNAGRICSWSGKKRDLCCESKIQFLMIIDSKQVGWCSREGYCSVRCRKEVSPPIAGSQDGTQSRHARWSYLPCFCRWAICSGLLYSAWSVF